MTQSGGGLKTLFLNNSLKFSKKWGEASPLSLRGPCQSNSLSLILTSSVVNGISCKVLIFASKDKVLVISSFGNRCGRKNLC